MSTGLSKSSRRRRRRGFTLLELTVTLLVLALMAVMIVPRFGGSARREFDLMVEHVADLLTMFAQRHQLQQNPVGIRYDEVTHELLLVILEPDPDNLDGPSVWRVDPYVTPISLPGDPSSFAVEVFADGEYVDIRDWPLATTPAERRPAIMVMLQGEEHTATIQLAAHAIVPQVSDARAVGGASTVDGVDLDAAGRSREDW